MKIQFGTSTLLLATAFAAICMGGMLLFSREFTSSSWGNLGWILLMTTPVFVPCLFVAYAVGRRGLTSKIVLAFAIIEAAAVGVFWVWK